MAQVLVRDVEPAVIDLLKDRARRNHRSLEAELRLILQDAAGTPGDEVARVRALFTELVFSDSSDLIREDHSR